MGVRLNTALIYLNQRLRRNLFNTNRHVQDKVVNAWMIIWLVIVFVLPLALLIGLYIKSSPLFQHTSVSDVLFSQEWRPLAGKFGFLSFIVSSIEVSLLAVLIAAPICVLSAIHLTQYANRYVLKIMRPVIDILAGLPSVIYGVWGVLVIVPFVGDVLGPAFGHENSGYTILSGAIVLAIMIIPFILNILIEVFESIPAELTEASLSLGATRWETIKHVLLRKAFPGIISAVGLGVSRAFGETIAVLMVVGNVVQIPDSVFHSGYPLPALIANNYGEMMSIPMYDSALMLASLLLFVIVLFFNFFSRMAIINFERKI